MHKTSRRVAIAVAMLGVFILGTTLWQAIVGKQHFHLQGNWAPVLQGISGAVLASLGISAYEYFRHAQAGARRREHAKYILTRSVASACYSLLLIFEYAGITMTYGGGLMAFLSLGGPGAPVAIWCGVSVLSYLVHHGARAARQHADTFIGWRVM